MTSLRRVLYLGLVTVIAGLVALGTTPKSARASVAMCEATNIQVASCNYNDIPSWLRASCASCDRNVICVHQNLPENQGGYHWATCEFES